MRDERNLRCRNVVRALALWLGACALSGCYVLQAARGQLDIAARQRPITQVLASSTTPDRLRQRLQYVAQAREFASRELGLPDNDSYKSYVDLERPYVVWNVFAAPELSVEPRQWCFLIAGCVVYRGYFNERAAQRYALKLQTRGYDATVGGVPAYSTLGHFDDPILNTMMQWNDAQLAAMVFHELAHQVVYVPGDSKFNEAFATTVEEEGLSRWLKFKDRADELRQWTLRRQRADEFYALLLSTRDRLDELYKSSLPKPEKQIRKQQQFGRLKFEYTQLKQKWHGYNGYDSWFDRRLSNADLVAVATYQSCVPGLQRLLAGVGGDLPRYYDEAGRLARADKTEREKAVCE